MTFRGLFLFIAALGVFAPANGAPLARADTDYVQSTLYADRAGFAPGETTWFALRQNVRQGWHVFWINPGNAGLPLALDWSMPAGFEAGDILHPAPEYIPVGPLASYAHEGAPVFLAPVTTPADAQIGDRVDVAINAFWQACEDICVPEETRFEFSLPVLAPQNGQASENRLLFVAARLEHPEPLTAPAEFRRTADGYELAINEWSGDETQDVFFFPEDEGLVKPAAPQSAAIVDGALIVKMTPGWIDGPPASDLRGVLRIGEGPLAQAFAVTSAVAPGTTVSAPPQGSPPALTGPADNIALMLVLAFFGGLILNAMPCVFPILFVKAASLMQSAQHEPRATRRHGLAYGVGVVLSFAAIGALLIALRSGGEQLGWGFHLQSPLVIGLSAYVLFAVGLSLAGVFVIGESIAGAGDALTRKSGAAGAFFTGVLAVAVAAPCIGPLLAAPMGAALTQSGPVAMAIFVTMALGLAAPFVAITMIPGLGRVLPKPGPWMAVFKQALAFPVFGAAAYFVWVFARQTGDVSLAGLLAGVVMLALAAWLYEQSKGNGARALFVRALSAAAIALALAPVLSARPAAPAASIERYGALSAEPYDGDAIAAYNAAGRPVFAIFTAAWCVTCQADKLTIFSSDSLAASIEAENGVVMVADWTLRDPDVTDALARLGAAGVPFYAYYGPGGSVAALAPPISKRDILAQFAKAAD